MYPMGKLGRTAIAFSRIVITFVGADENCMWLSGKKYDKGSNF